MVEWLERLGYVARSCQKVNILNPGIGHLMSGNHSLSTGSKWVPF